MASLSQMNRSGQLWQSALVTHPPVPPVPPTPADPPIPAAPAVPPVPAVPPLPLEPPQPNKQPPPAPPAPPEPEEPAVPPLPEDPPAMRGPFGSSPQPSTTVNKRRPRARQCDANGMVRRLAIVLGLMVAAPPGSWARPRLGGMRRPVVLDSRRSSNRSHHPAHIPCVHPARARGN